MLKLGYEVKHGSHREFFRIAAIENENEKRNEIEKLMKSPYGVTIEQWLKKYL